MIRRFKRVVFVSLVWPATALAGTGHWFEFGGLLHRLQEWARWVVGS